MTEQTQPEIEVSLVLSVSHINTILGALNEIPHKFSRAVIDEIHKQAQSQIPNN